MDITWKLTLKLFTLLTWCSGEHWTGAKKTRAARGIHYNTWL